MKRYLLIFVIVTFAGLGFFNLSTAQCPQDPNDNGVCDTLYFSHLFYPPPWVPWPPPLPPWPWPPFPIPQFVCVSLSVTHDVPDPAIDSIAGFVIPLCFHHNNVAKYCSLSHYWNRVGWTTSERPRSIFRHLPSMSDPQVHNWMMDQYEEGNGEEWNTIILDLDGTSHFWLSMVPSGAEDQKFGENTKTLLATMTFKLEDTMTICIDTCFWPPSSRLAFTRSDAVTYMPRIWDDYLGQAEYCFGLPTCVEALLEIESSKFAWSWWWVHPPKKVWLTDPNVHDVVITEITKDEFSCIQSVKSIDSNDDTVMVKFSVTSPGSAHASFYYNSYEQARITEQYMDVDSSLKVAFLYYPNTDLNAYFVVKHISADTFHLEFGIGDDTISGALANNDEYPIVLQQIHQMLAQLQDSAIVAATDHTLLDPVVCQAASFLQDSLLQDSLSQLLVKADTTSKIDKLLLCLTAVGTADGLFCKGWCSGVVALINLPNLFTLAAMLSPTLFIPNTDTCVNPGDYVTLPILLQNNPVPFGGFELEVEFDYTAMTFVGAEMGRLLTDLDSLDVGPPPKHYSWEYFQYRMLPCPACACCKYKILLLGMMDLPNGSNNVGVPIPENSNGELALLHFVVNNDENLRGLTIPVCWEWEGTVVNDTLVEDWDCAENTFSDATGNILYVSKLPCQYRNLPECDAPSGGIQPVLIFQDGICGQNCGGVDVCPAGPGFCKRGDVNYNTLPYEVADAVLFASYFAEGLSVFSPDDSLRAYQICATDVNADGRSLTLSDLVYLIRVILHDAVEIPKLAPSSENVNVIISNHTITTECAGSIGAILFEFDGAVVPTLLADKMEMIAKDNKVLVWSREGHSLESTAKVVSFAGDANLTSVTAVDRDSRELKTSFVGKTAPVNFALHPAYPNPFNPSTNLSFTLPVALNYSLKIFNVTGQLVKSYEGMGKVGLNVITWDSKDNAGDEVASGIYFYQLTAGSFSATQKMVVVK